MFDRKEISKDSKKANTAKSYKRRDDAEIHDQSLPLHGI